MPDRNYDVVLLGATGFTGRLTANHLAARLADSPLRWAIAGRDERKLEELRDDLAVVGSEPDVEVADVTDLAALLRLAEQTRVLASTVGPYVTHGELVVQACVRSGTDYCDITGEPPFVDLLLDRYDGDARERGVRIVNCCGFDSIPHDLGVQFTVQQLPADTPKTVRGYVRAKGTPSGGTWASALGILADFDPGSLVRRGGKDQRRRASEKRVHGLPPRIHCVRQLEAVAVPLPTIDPAVVLRSARALDYGPSFAYGHFLEVPNAASAAGVVAGAGVLLGLAKIQPVRRRLVALRPAGSGPSEQQRAGAWFRVTFVAEADGTPLVTRVSGDDPGYGGTAKMLGESALSLAEDSLPDTAGVVTPAVAMGEALRHRLDGDALRFAGCLLVISRGRGTSRPAATPALPAPPRGGPPLEPPWRAGRATAA